LMNKLNISEYEARNYLKQFSNNDGVNYDD